MFKRRKPYFYREKSRAGFYISAVLVAVITTGIWLLQYPQVQQMLGWRFDTVWTAVRTVIKPIGDQPTPAAAAPTLAPFYLPPTPTTALAVQPTAAAIESTTIPPTPAPVVTPTPLPDRVQLPAPAYERQDWNNCGPAALAMALKFWGWEGDQYTIAKVIKPERADRNVNIDELAGYVANQAGEYRSIFRVNGSVDQAKMLIAAGFPVMIEASMLLEENFWYNDDRWSGHYLLLTGYNDGDQTFFTQDAFLGPNRQVSYSQIDQDWISFNRVFMLIYPADREGEIAGLLGEDWNPDINRQRALQKAQAETEADPRNVFAWFNLGSNLTYFERYDEAVQAYDQARQMNLPQRMLRYQFGPFLAYFHSGRNDDLLAMTEYALSVTPNSEEALLWRGWAQYRAGDRNDALANFQKALDARPDYGDAQYAYSYVVQN